MKSFPAISLPGSARDPILIKRMTEGIPGEDVDHSLSNPRQLFVSISHPIGSLFRLRHGWYVRAVALFSVVSKTFFACFQKKDTPESVTLLFSPKKLIRLFIQKKVKPSPNSKMIKLHTSDNLFLPLRHSCAKTLCRMTTAITFLPQNHADSRVSNTQYRENLVFVVVTKSESLDYLVLYVDVYCRQHLNTGFHDCNLRRSATRSKTVFVGRSLRPSQVVQCCSHLF